MPNVIAMLSIHTSPLDEPGVTKDAGGMNVYIRELAQELGSQGIDIDIFTRRTSASLPHIVQLDAHVRVIHIEAGPIAAIHKNELYQYIPQFVRSIDHFKRSEALHYDIIHSHYWLSGVAAMQLASSWNVPHVTMFHTLGRLKIEANPGEREPALRLRMEQQLLRQVDRVIAATVEEYEQIMQYFEQVVAEHIRVIPCGIDLDLFLPSDRWGARERLGLRQDVPVVLFVGRLDPFKGPDLFLRLAALMHEEAQLVIVGGKLMGDAELDGLRRLACELGIDSRVRFLGSRPREEMPMLYNAADITVVPSYHESFSLTAIESLACGTPVVATRAGGLQTVVRHNETGFLVPRTPEAFAEKVDVLLQHAPLHASMSLAARDSVVRFGWRNIAQQMDEVYTEVIEKKVSKGHFQVIV